MSTSLLYHAFGLRGYQHIRSSFADGRVTLCLRQPRNQLRCSQCGSDNVWAQGSVPRTFRTLPIGLKPVQIEFAVPRVHCFACGLTRQVKLRFADPRKSYTRAFERYALDLSRHMTIKAVATHLQVSWDVKVLDRVAASANWGFINTADAARQRVKKQQRWGLFGRFAQFMGFAGGGLALPVYGHTRRANQEEIIRSIRGYRANQGLGLARLEHDDALIGHTLSPDVFSRIPKGSTVTGIGSVGLALKTPEGDVVRLQAEEMVKRVLAMRPELDPAVYSTARPNISTVLQATHSQQLGSKFLERVPLASPIPESQVNESILKLIQTTRSEGFVFSDHHSGNVGRVGGNDFIVDPGAVMPLDYYKNLMAKNRKRLLSSEARSADRRRNMLLPGSPNFGNNAATGSFANGMANGGPAGLVPGVGNTDSVPLRLPVGSYVIKKNNPPRCSLHSTSLDGNGRICGSSGEERPVDATIPLSYCRTLCRVSDLWSGTCPLNSLTIRSPRR